MSASDKQDRKNAGQPNAEDFKWWQARAREMSWEALWWSRKDCNEAARAMRTEPISSWYIDEATVYAAEIERRKNGGR